MGTAEANEGSEWRAFLDSVRKEFATRSGQLEHRAPRRSIGLAERCSGDGAPDDESAYYRAPVKSHRALACSIVAIGAALLAGPHAADVRGAQQTPGAAPTLVRPGDPQPVRTKSVKPVYPPEAVQARQEGIVILEIVISETGKVIDAKVLRRVSDSLDEAARAAVLQWEFQPVLENGTAVPKTFRVAVTFTLTPSGSSTTAAPASSAPAASAPSPGAASVYGRWQCRGNEIAFDAFTIRPDGSVRFVGSSDEGRAIVAGNTVRFEQVSDNPLFYDRRIFQFTLSGNQLRGTRTETARDRPARIDQYVCTRQDASDAAASASRDQAIGGSETLKLVLDSILTALDTFGNQRSASSLRNDIASGQIRDERALDAALTSLLAEADSPALRLLQQQLRTMLAAQAAAAGTPTAPPAPGAGRAAGPQTPGAAQQHRRLDGRWRCGENSRCNGATEIVVPQLSSGGFRFMDSRGFVAATMDFFWDRTEPSPSSSPSQRRVDIILRMEARNRSLCSVTVGGTVYANGQTAGYVGSASSAEPSLAVAANGGSVTRTYTFRGIPDGATLTIRTGDSVRDICLP